MPIRFAPLPPGSLTEATRHGWPYDVQADVRKRFYRRGGHAPEEAHRVFYLGTHRSGWLAAEPGKDVPTDVLAQWLAKVNVPLFISRRQLEKRKVLPRASARWALDSGGFSELSMHGDWKLAARDYVRLVRRFRDEIGLLDWAAPQDWMCETTMTDRTGLSRPQHIVRTVSSFLELRSMAPDLPIIPVLQGLTEEDYYVCAELYAKAGVDLRKEPVVGVGSICRRQHEMEALRIVEILANDGMRLHGFGFKKAGLALAKKWFVSADSMAWSFRGRRCEWSCPEGKASCANCLHSALTWRNELLGTLGPEWQLTAAEVRKSNPVRRGDLRQIVRGAVEAAPSIALHHVQGALGQRDEEHAEIQIDIFRPLPEEPPEGAADREGQRGPQGVVPQLALVTALPAGLAEAGVGPTIVVEPAARVEGIGDG